MRDQLHRSGALLTILVLLLSGCTALSSSGELAGESEALTPLTFCTAAVSPLHLPAWYAYEEGLFEQYGLDVELVGLKNGSTAATAMIAGEVDACQVAASNIVNAVLAEEELVLIGGLFNRHVYSLMVRPEIQSAADLKGKSIAVTRPGTATDTSLGVALDHLGLERDQDVAVVFGGSHGDNMAALTAGSVDGVIQGAPLMFQSEALGFNQLLDLSILPYPYQHNSVATSREFIEDQREVSLNLMRAISHATQQLKRDPDGAKAVMAKYLTLDPAADEKLLQTTYETVVLGQLEALPYPSMAGIEAVIDIARQTNPKAEGFQAAEVVDLSLMEALESSGFLSGLEE